VVTKGATVVSRPADSVILVDAGLHALNSRAIAYRNRIMSDFWDIYVVTKPYVKTCSIFFIFFIVIPCNRSGYISY